VGPGDKPGAAEARLEGHVGWLGLPPAVAALPTNASVQSVCGASVADATLRVDGQGDVAEVVVWVEAPAEATPVGLPAVVLDQRLCADQPSVLAARAGQTLRLQNSDPLTHTVHATRAGQTIFNVAMPLQHAELTRTLPLAPGLVDIRCDVHPWMRAVVRTFDHPHFTTTDASGRYRLSGLGPGDVHLHAWHPRLGEASRLVRLGETATRADFDFGGKP
jgi:plastocyanin